MKQILWTACVTPFLNNKVDYKSLKSTLILQNSAKNGILLLGSTGEALSLSVEEKKEIVNFVCDLQLSSEIIVGVPGIDLLAAIEWMQYCNDLPINGYLITTPIYAKPGIIGQTLWFESLLDHANKPCMLYNIPSRAGVKLYAEVVENLMQHDKFWAVKDSSGNVNSIAEYKILSPEVEVFCGDDYMMPAMVAFGASGLISVGSNVWPKAVRSYVKGLISGVDVDLKVWWHAFKSLLTASNPIPIKALMSEIGLISSAEVRLPLHADDLPASDLLINMHNQIIDWEKLYAK